MVSSDLGKLEVRRHLISGAPCAIAGAATSVVAPATAPPLRNVRRFMLGSLPGSKFQTYRGLATVFADRLPVPIAEFKLGAEGLLASVARMERSAIRATRARRKAAQSSFALTNSARTALVACTASMALSA